MGTCALTLVNIALIFQATLGAYSFGDPEGSRLVRWNDIGKDKPGIILRKYFISREKPSILRGVYKEPSVSNQLDDIIESQFPAPPTMNEPSSEGFRREMAAHNEESYSDDRPITSGAGHLETNEIMKDPWSILENNSAPNSNEFLSGNNEVPDNTHQPIRTYGKALNFAVEHVMNQISSSDETNSPHVKVIKLLNDANKRQTDVGNSGNNEPENSANNDKKLLLLHVIMKLAKRVPDAVADCGCENGNCQEASKSDQEQTLLNDQNILSQTQPEPYEAENINDIENGGILENKPSFKYNHPYPFARIFIGLKTRGLEGDMNRIPPILVNSLRNGREYSTTQPSNRVNVYDKDQISSQLFRPDFTISKPKTFGAPDEYNTIHKEFSSEEGLNSIPTLNSMGISPLFQKTTPRDIVMMRSQIKEDNTKQVSHFTSPMRLTSGNSKNNIKNEEIFSPDDLKENLFAGLGTPFALSQIAKSQFNIPASNEYGIFKSIIDVLKEKAATNANLGIEDNKIDQGVSQIPTEEQSNVPLATPSRFVIIGSKEQSTRQLSPSRLFKEKSGFNFVKPLPFDQYSEPREIFNQPFTNKDRTDEFSKGVDNDSSDTLGVPCRQEVIQDPKYGEEDSNNGPKELQETLRNTLLRKLISQRLARFDRIQGSPTQIFNSPQNDDQENPVFLRSVLAPFSV